MINDEQGIELLREFLKINTSNPPGDEEGAAQFLEARLAKAGIKAEMFLSAPKRANLLARIPGRKRGKPIILLSHIDVVPANPDEWTVDPFGGEVKDGFVYGRGAIDMKSQTICHLIALLNLHEKGIVPEQDILFVATGDEEVGGELGAGYMLNAVPELKDASFVLSEGGNVVEEGGRLFAQISVAEKKLSQFRIRATGISGHGSQPHRTSANKKVIDAAHAIGSYEWPMKPTAVASAYLNGILKGRVIGGYKFANLKEALKDKRFRSLVEDNALFNAMLRNTATPTILRGGEKVNVIPSEATIDFDARLLPTESHEAFLRKVRALAGKEVEVTPLSGSDNPAPSGYNTGFFKGIARSVRRLKGPVPVLPFVTTGATDLRHFRSLGIPAYGFFPAVIAEEEQMRMHGKDERISVESFLEGMRGIDDIVRFLAAAGPKG